MSFIGGYFPGGGGGRHLAVNSVQAPRHLQTTKSFLRNILSSFPTARRGQGIKTLLMMMLNKKSIYRP